MGIWDWTALIVFVLVCIAVACFRRGRFSPRVVWEDDDTVESVGPDTHG